MNDTLKFYDENSEQYSFKTFNANMSVLQEEFLSCLNYGDSILDLGCGSGRDSKYFTERGFKVTPVDGSEGMCQMAEKNTGLKVRKLLFSDLDYDGEFDGVYACCSLLHVPSEELPAIIRLVGKALKPNGLFFCCFKKGEFEGIKHEDCRYYTDLTVKSLTDLVMDNGFMPLRTWESLEPGRDLAWVNCLCRKF